MNENVRKNSIKAWFLAARPKTLTGATVPVMIGTVLAFKDGGTESFQLIPALLCFFFAWIMQIDSNFINDYFDCLKGNDDSATRLGPQRACSEGWISMSAMRKGLIVTTLLGCIVGLPLVIYGGVEMIVVGILCVVFAFLYTTQLSYLGLGDVLVMVFFGIVPVCLTYYVILPENLQYISGEVFLSSLACGFVIDTLLLVNNYRDRENDKRDGKVTLVVRIGEYKTERLYFFVGLIGDLLMLLVEFGIMLSIRGGLDLMSLLVFPLPLAYLILHRATWKTMRKIYKGRELNKVLGLTARNIFAFGFVHTVQILCLAIYNIVR